MIKLKLKFDGKDYQEFNIEENTRLRDVVKIATGSVPLGQSSIEDAFNTVVNGHKIDSDFWNLVEITPLDKVLITPKITGGESGQIFRQVAILAITVVASVYLGPQAGATAGQMIGGALAVAAVSLGATLALYALIPPLQPGFDGDNASGPESSQMYAITGQSNERKTYGTVPKVYGTHRMFPNIAANPYVELAVDKVTGETIQYLVAAYDFGMGTPIVTDLKIGDTELTSENFTDFQYRFVDPAKPSSGTDSFDDRLSPVFELYKGDRQITPLSLALNETGDTATQNTAPNTKNFPNEISLDLVAPTGLYGYSSGGTLGERTVSFQVEFALVGSNDWRSYNDDTYSDSWSSTGGQDLTDFSVKPVQLLPTHPLYSTYYFPPNFTVPPGLFNGQDILYSEGSVSIRWQSNKLLVATPVNNLTQYNPGSKVLIKGKFVGYVQSSAPLAPPYAAYTEIVVDRSLSAIYVLGGLFEVYGLKGESTFVYADPNNPLFSWVSTFGTGDHYTFSRHTLSQFNIYSTGKTSAVYATLRFRPKIAGQYKVRVRRTGAFGPYSSSVADAVTWSALSTNLDNQPIKTTTRHTFLELRIRATDQLNGQIQNLSAVVAQPIPVYDPDTETWTRQITSNPAWIFCDLLTGEVNKKAVPLSRLHMDSILEWADFCNQIPTPPPGADYLEPRFQANFVLDYNATLQQVLQQLGGMAQASLNIVDGKYGVLIDRLKTTPVQIFTPRNSKEFVSNRIYTTRPDAVKITYIDPKASWEAREVVVYDNGFDEETAEEFDEMTAFATTNNEQAWRFGRYMIAQNRLRQETMTIQVDFENLVCTRGDYVQVTQDVMQVGGRPARVRSITGSTCVIDDALDINPSLSYGYTFRSSSGEITTSTLTPLSARSFELDGPNLPEEGDLIVIGEVGSLTIDCIVKAIDPNDDLSAQITLVERANEIFDYESTNTFPEYDPQFSQTSDPTFIPPKAVENLTLGDVSWQCAETKSGYQYYAEVVWDMPLGSIYSFFEIWYNDGSGYRSVGTTSVKYWKQILTQDRLGQNMGIKVVAVSASGKKLDLIAMPTVTFPTSIKSTPPSDVQGFGMSITQQVLQLAWQAVPDCDVFRYEVRYSPEVNDIWEASVPLQIVDRNINSFSVQARTGIYFIKAIDFAGNKSLNAAVSLTTIPNLFDLNVIETLNDFPDFEGSKEQVEKVGEAVILTERVHGDVNTMEYYSDGYYLVKDLLDLGEIYSARLQSLIRADGYRFGEMMSSWEHLSDVEHLSSANTEDWDVTAEYRATNEILSMSSWAHLYDVEHLNEGLGQGFTEWRTIPTIGDATGRVFQFRIHLKSITPNVTPRLFDGTIKIDMQDRDVTFENLISSASDATAVSYGKSFAGPGTSPNIQISIDGGESGDYWTFGTKTLEGFTIRFFDKDDTQVVRTFDVVARGYGSRHIVTI